MSTYSVPPFGFVKPVIREALRHCRSLVSDRAYRECQWLNLKLVRLPRFYPGKIRISNDTICFADSASLLSSWYEIFINQIYDIGDVQGKPFLIDAGANIGLAQLYWKRRYKNFTSICFEPDPKIATVLESNLTNWGCATQVVRAALANRSGSITFYSEGADGGRVGVNDKNKSFKQLTVPTVRLSDYIDRTVDLLKIDIEGAEYDVLNEVQDKLPFVKKIFVECHSFVEKEQDYMEVLAILKRSGFRCYVDIGIPQINPFGQQRSSYNDIDLALNIFGIRA